MDTAPHSHKRLMIQNLGLGRTSSLEVGREGDEDTTLTGRDAIGELVATWTTLPSPLPPLVRSAINLYTQTKRQIICKKNTNTPLISNIYFLHIRERGSLTCLLAPYPSQDAAAPYQQL